MDLRSERSVAMHWGMFRLAKETPVEPSVYLRKALMEAGLGSKAFVVMRFGETPRLE